jgi:hypothetical protein
VPFQSKAQQRMMFAKHPEIAKRWAKETDDIKSLPEKAKKKPMKKKADDGRFFRDLDGRDNGMFMGKLAQGAAAAGATSTNASGSKPGQSTSSETTKLDIGATGAPMGGSGFRGQGMGGGMYGTGTGKVASLAPSDWDADAGMPTGFHRPAREQPEGLEEGGERFHSTESNSVVPPTNRQRHGLVEGGSMTMRATAGSQMGKHASTRRFMGTSFDKVAFAPSPSEKRDAPGVGGYVSGRAGEFRGSLGRAAEGVGSALSEGVKSVTRSPVGATLATVLAAKLGLGGLKRVARGMRGTKAVAKSAPAARGGKGLIGGLMSGARDLVSGARNFVTK